MKNKLKKLHDFLLYIVQTITSLFSVILFSRFRLAKFNKIINDDRKCNIFGNGPSLRKELSENFILLKKHRENTICVNLFFEDDIFIKFRPGYYLIVDGAMWSTTADIKILNIQTSFIKNMNKVDWEMKLLVPYEAKRFVQKNIKNGNINCIYFNRTPVNGFKKFRHLIYKKNLGMPAPYNVLNAALMISINLGFNEINIYGADHSWISDLFVDENNTLCCYQNHFYDDRSDFVKLEKGSLYKGLMGIVLAFQSYELINKYAESKNIKIVNRTNKSFLDIFNFQ